MKSLLGCCGRNVLARQPPLITHRLQGIDEEGEINFPLFIWLVSSRHLAYLNVICITQWGHCNTHTHTYTYKTMNWPAKHGFCICMQSLTKGGGVAKNKYIIRSYIWIAYLHTEGGSWETQWDCRPFSVHGRRPAWSVGWSVCVVGGGVNMVELTNSNLTFG